MRKKKSLLRVLAILCLPQSTYSVPDMLFNYTTLTQGWREGGVCCAMGKFQKLPNQMVAAQRYQKLPGCASTTEKSSLTQVPAGLLLILSILSPCKGQSLQQVSEYLARINGFVHAGLPWVFREARPAATTLLQESQAVLDSSFLPTGPDTEILNQRNLRQEKHTDKKDKFIFRLVIFIHR